MKMLILSPAHFEMEKRIHPLSRSNVSTSNQGIHLPGDTLTVAVPDCIKQSIPIPLLRTVIKPFDDCCFKSLFDFCIQDHQSDHPVRQFALIILFPRLGQVSCQIQRTPEIIFRRMQIVLRSLLLFYLRCILAAGWISDFSGWFCGAIRFFLALIAFFLFSLDDATPME